MDDTGSSRKPFDDESATGPHRKKSVLFVCTGNACRSQMGEALLRHVGSDQFDVASAGTHPAGFVSPLALDALHALGIQYDSGESKNWREFEGCTFDLVIYLCENAMQQEPPSWSGPARRVEWPLPDPTFHLGSDDDRREFALCIAKRLAGKIGGLMAMNWNLPDETITAHLGILADF